MMKLMELLKSRLQRESRWLDLAEGIADRAFERVWQRVRGRILELPLAEARGYLQARAGMILRDAVLAETGARGLARVYAPAMQATMVRTLERMHAVRAAHHSRRAA